MIQLNAENIAIILAIFVPLTTAIVFIVKLEMRVKYLEKELERNPILNVLKQFEEGVLIKIISEFVSIRLEKKNG